MASENNGLKTFENLDSGKRDRIMDVASDEFAEHGFHQASVNRMVSRLGIAKGSLFKYFGSKQGLFEYVFGQAVSMFKTPLKQARAHGDDFFERILLSLLAGMDFIESHPRIYKIYLKIMFQENVPFRQVFLGKVRAFSAEYIGPMLDEGVASGQLRPDLDRDTALFFLDGLMDRFLQALSVPYIYPELHGLNRDEAENYARRLVELMRHGLAANGDQS